MYQAQIDKETNRKTEETRGKNYVEKKKVGLLSKLITVKDSVKEDQKKGLA